MRKIVRSYTAECFYCAAHSSITSLPQRYYSLHIRFYAIENMQGKAPCTVNGGIRRLFIHFPNDLSNLISMLYKIS